MGAAARSARLSRGLSLEVVAGLAGHSKSWLSKVERGLLPLVQPARHRCPRRRRADLAHRPDQHGVGGAAGGRPGERRWTPRAAGFR
ncbi:MAG: helix-turn-helix transcriptional regulator [Actinobacteria bacterium]|nr:helix-turn-helix transcriptional regulator [Actinomycetota bacterium]